MKVCETNKMSKHAIYAFFFLLLMACSTPKNITYFQGLQHLDEVNIKQSKKLKYKPKDIVSIVVSAEDPETTIPFNRSTTVNTGSEDGSNTNSAQASTYLIDDNGNIEFPVLGRIKVGNLTNTQVKTIIKEKLRKFINNPIVTVKLENFRITILGDVATPGEVLVNNEEVTLIEAIGLAGDLNITGKRNNITVIRKVEDAKKVVYKVDLTSTEFFNSPVYHLAQNDIIYVEPNASKKKSSREDQWSVILRNTSSILGIAISLILLTR